MLFGSHQVAGMRQTQCCRIYWDSKPGSKLAHSPSASSRTAAKVLAGKASGVERVRAGDHLEDLLGDLRLAGAVHRQRQRVDQLARALRGAPHRGHPRPLLRGRGLEERAVELRLEVYGQEAGQDLLRLGLVDEVAPERALLRL